MIPAKTSEGLIGNEGAIYPCPKGQGIIAKTWGLIDKNIAIFDIIIENLSKEKRTIRKIYRNSNLDFDLKFINLQFINSNKQRQLYVQAVADVDGLIDYL